MRRRTVLLSLLGVAAAAGLTGVMALRGTPARHGAIDPGTAGDGPSAQVTIRVDGMT